MMYSTPMIFAPLVLPSKITLDDILTQDRAVVVRLHLNPRMAVVEMEAIQVGVDGLNGRLGLQHRSAGLQQLGFPDSGLPGVSTGDFVSGAEQAHSSVQVRERLSIGIAVA